jgi:SAM-dependent methyltransferase
MGCASGRVIRHFLCQERGLDLWASDINSGHVEWILKYLQGDIRVFQNHALPHLPLEDNTLDLAYAFSVFSHIDAFDLAWLLELRRVLKPGGLAYLTTHTEHTWSIMKAGDTIYDILLDHPDFSPELLKSKLPLEKIVYQWRTDNSYRASVFYDTEYIRHVWGKYYEVLDIIPEGHFYQDVILLRKN